MTSSDTQLDSTPWTKPGPTSTGSIRPWRPRPASCRGAPSSRRRPRTPVRRRCPRSDLVLSLGGQLVVGGAEHRGHVDRLFEVVGHSPPPRSWRSGEKPVEGPLSLSPLDAVHI